MARTPRREIKQLVVEVTEACNHACMHCYNYWRPRRGDVPILPAAAATVERGRRVLTRPDFVRLVKKIKRDARLRYIALSGGEPFLRPDLPEIVSDLSNEGEGLVTITNGSLITEERLRRMPEHSNFEITLFSAHRETHDAIAGRKSFDRLLETFLLLQKHHCGLVIACVLSRLNAADVALTMELAVAVGAQAVMLNRVNLSRPALPLATDLVPSPEVLRETLGAADRMAEKYGLGVVLSVPVPPCVVDPSEFSHLQAGWCPRGGKDAYYTLGCTGLVRPCNHTSVVLGDLLQQNWFEIVESKQAREYWASVPEECRTCTHPLKDSCAGGCRAAAQECYGSTAMIDPFVRFARAAQA